MGPDQRADEFAGSLGPGQCRPQEGPGVPVVGPAAAARSGVRAQHPVALVGLQLPAHGPIGREDGVCSVAQARAPDGADVRVAGAAEVVMRSRQLESLEISSGHEVGHAGHGVGAVNGRGALLQDFDAVERDGGEGVDVHEPAAGKSGRGVYLAAAVQQRQCSRGAQASQIDVGRGLRNERPGLIVPAVALADRAVGRAQFLEEVHCLRRALLLQRFAVGHVDRERQILRRGRKVRAGHHGRQLPQRDGSLGGQLHVDARALPGPHDHARTHCVDEAGKGEAQRIRTRREAGKRVHSLRGRHRRARFVAERRPRRRDRHGGHREALLVGHGSGDGSFLREGGRGPHECKSGQAGSEHALSLHLHGHRTSGKPSGGRRCCDACSYPYASRKRTPSSYGRARICNPAGSLP